MSALPPGVITAGVFFMLSLASGVWLSRLGRPVNVVVVTIHKLISLATVVFTGVATYNLSRAGAVSSLGWSAIAVTGLLFIVLFFSGAVLSTPKPENKILSATHKVVPILSLLSTTATIYILAVGKF